jgi:hypothetical protein
MVQGLLAMSSAKRERLVVIGQVARKILRQGWQRSRLGRCVRQVKRLVRGLSRRGRRRSGFASARAGAESSFGCGRDGSGERLSSEHVRGFGTTLGAERLAELEGITVSRRLRIELIAALTPQAKGRIERVNQTLKDRLVREMRLRGISTIEKAQAFAPTFMAQWNARFAMRRETAGTPIARGSTVWTRSTRRWPGARSAPCRRP